MQPTRTVIGKKWTNLLNSLFAAVLLAFLSGCASTRQTEDLLTAAGFKTVSATTPARQALLKSLHAGKISSVQQDGKQYFVYPDASRNVLYTGQAAQYEQYKKLHAQKQLANDQLLQVEQTQLQVPTQVDW